MGHCAGRLYRAEGFDRDNSYLVLRIITYSGGYYCILFQEQHFIYFVQTCVRVEATRARVDENIASKSWKSARGCASNSLA